MDDLNVLKKALRLAVKAEKALQDLVIHAVDYEYTEGWKEANRLSGIASSLKFTHGTSPEDESDKSKIRQECTKAVKRNPEWKILRDAQKIRETLDKKYQDAMRR